MDAPTQPACGVAADLPVGAVWQKSSYSGTQGNCVEVATNLPGHVAVRDSKDRGGEVLAFDAAAWREFVGRVKSGRADVG